MATEEELFSAIQSFEPVQMSPERQAAIAAQQEKVRQAKAEVAAKEAAIPTFLPAVGAALSGAGQGLSLGWADEALAGLSSLFGSTSYSNELAAQQAEQERIAAAYPKTYLGGQIAGGLAGALPAITVAAPTTASRLLLGATGSAAPTLGQLAAIGATQGAITGAGSAKPGERLVGSLYGGSIGAVASPIVGKLAQVGTQKLGESLALLKPLLSQTGSETGAINIGGKPLLSEAEIDLAKMLSQTAPTNIKNAEIALMRAGELNKPVFLPEAVQSPALYQQAKLIANYPSSVELAKTAIESRAANAVDRMTQTLDLVHPERNVTAGANKLVEGAQNILEQLGVARKEATAGLYESAFAKTPQLQNQDAIDLISGNPRIQQAIRQVRKEIPELGDLPDTSLEVLHQAQQYLSGKARSLTNKYTAGKVKDARNALMTAIKAESPDYADATSTFAKMSKGLTAKEQSKIGFLATVSPNRPETIGRVFALDPDVIASLRSDFIDAGLSSEWEAGVRSYLQRALNKAQDARNPINKLIGSPELRDKLKSALGDKADKIIEPLSIEQTMLQGQKEYFANSSTAPLLMREQATEESKNAIRRGLEAIKDPVSTLGKFLSDALGAKKDTKFYEDYARLLFSNPEHGLETLGTIQKLAEGFRAARTAGDIAGQALGATSGKETARSLESISKMGKRNTAITNTPTQPIISENNVDDLFKQIQSFNVPTDAVSMPVKQDISFLIDDAAQRHGVDPKLVRAVIHTESSGNPNAVSSKGAQGYMQLMPATAKALGVTDPLDPAQNIEGGVKYLAQLIKKFGDEKLALAAYNWGEGNIRKQLDRLAKRNKPQTLAAILKFGTLPTETENYIRKISRLTEEA